MIASRPAPVEGPAETDAHRCSTQETFRPES